MDYNHTSLCIVTHRDNAQNGLRQKMLARVADYNANDSSLVPCNIIDYMPKTFSNRDMLYARDGNGPDADYEVGIWNWKASPNNNDISRDYIECDFVKELVPIIAFHQHASTIQNLIENLKKGIPFQYHVKHVLIYTTQISGNYECVYCNQNNCSFENGCITLKTEAAAIYIYRLPIFNFLPISNDLKAYKYFTIRGKGIKQNLKSENEVVRQIIIDRFSWKSASNVGLTKSSWQSLKKFINNFSSDLIHEIAEACNCSSGEAENHLSTFLSSGDESITTGILDYIRDDEIEYIIETNEQIKQKFSEVYDKKYFEISIEIEEEKKKLGSLKSEVSSLDNQKQNLCQQVETLQDKKNQLDMQLAEKDRLTQQVTAKLQEKVDAIRQDALLALDEIPVLSGLFAQSRITEKKNISEDPIYKPGVPYKENELELLSSWQDQITVLAESLEGTGVMDAFTQLTARFLFLAWFHHIPILIAGPCGENIAHAFSVSVFGRTAGIINCDVLTTDESISNILESDESVILVRNPLHSGHTDNFLRMIHNNDTDKFFIAVTPYADDLCIEPDGLMNYVLPIFTDLIVDNLPDNNYVPAKRSSTFESFVTKKHEKIKALNNLRLTPVALSLANKEFGDLLDIETKISEAEILYRYAIVPYSYTTNRREQAAVMITEETRLNTETKQQLLAFLGWEDE